MAIRDRILTWLLAVGMVTIGVAHFVTPEPFARIVPPVFGAPVFWVLFSGFFEIAGGVGLLFERTRRAAAWGLVALFICVFPANLYMATSGIQPVPEAPVSALAAWARLPFQAVLIGWAWWLTRVDQKVSKPPMHV